MNDTTPNALEQDADSIQPAVADIREFLHAAECYEYLYSIDVHDAAAVAAVKATAPARRRRRVNMMLDTVVRWVIDTRHEIQCAAGLESPRYWPADVDTIDVDTIAKFEAYYRLGACGILATALVGGERVGDDPIPFLGGICDPPEGEFRPVVEECLRRLLGSLDATILVVSTIDTTLADQDDRPPKLAFTAVGRAGLRRSYLADYSRRRNVVKPSAGELTGWVSADEIGLDGDLTVWHRSTLRRGLLASLRLDSEIVMNGNDPLPIVFMNDAGRTADGRPSAWAGAYNAIVEQSAAAEPSPADADPAAEPS